MILGKLISTKPWLARLTLPYVVTAKHYNTKEQIEYRRRSSQALIIAGKHTTQIESRVHFLPMKFSAEQLLLKFADDESILSMKPQIDEGDWNYLKATEMIAAGRPVILGCSYFSCIYYTLLCLQGLATKAFVITAADPSNALPLFRKIGRIAGVDITVASAQEPLIGVSILRMLKRGVPVVTMLDCFFAGESTDHSELLGRPAASPGNLYRLAQRSQAIVVPLAAIRRGKTLRLEVGRLIDMRDTSSESASQAVNRYFSEMVSEYAEQWMGWSNLLTRWEISERAAARAKT